MTRPPAPARSVTEWTYYRLHNRRCEVVGWMRVAQVCDRCTQICSRKRAEYIGLCGERWQTLDLPYFDRVRLTGIPIGLEYLPGAAAD